MLALTQSGCGFGLLTLPAAKRTRLGLPAGKVSGPGSFENLTRLMVWVKFRTSFYVTDKNISLPGGTSTGK